MRSRYESSEDEFSYREEEILASSLSSPSLRSYAVKNKSKSKSKSSVGGDDPHSNFLEAEDGEPLPRLPTPILHDHDDSEDPLPPPPPQHEEAIHWILERVLQDVLEYIQPYLEDHVNTVQTDLDRYCREIQETQADQTRALSEQIERIQKIKRDIDGLQYQNTTTKPRSYSSRPWKIRLGEW
ncbi:hypothetical protein BGZ54_000793 [Gamsiella multidivaricata]|nr:hypothetical protein BGZ54_000793 [Gamsiella multidivaricata]